MIDISNVQVFGFEPAIRGMRNPMNSWDKSDSFFYDSDSEGIHQYHSFHEEFLDEDDVKEAGLYPHPNDVIGRNDLDLMKRLAANGSVHAKYRRMITVYMDILAPLYWWKEFDTYKVGTVANSCSTMHKIHAKEFIKDDFSFDHLTDLEEFIPEDWSKRLHEKDVRSAIAHHDDLEFIYGEIIGTLNRFRELYLQTKDKRYWWQMIQLLPSSYNQRRTVMLNYEVLANIYHDRKDHKLDEWREFCEYIKDNLPYSKLFTGGLSTDA